MELSEKLEKIIKQAMFNHSVLRHEPEFKDTLETSQAGLEIEYGDFPKKLADAICKSDVIKEVK